jgi:arginine/ornithine N-succinyltransferase beta subunit
MRQSRFSMRPDALLDFERAHPRHTGAKEEAIIRDLGVKPARYYQLLHRAAMSLEGRAHDAITARIVMSRSADVGLNISLPGVATGR